MSFLTFRIDPVLSTPTTLSSAVPQPLRRLPVVGLQGTEQSCDFGVMKAGDGI